jgi:hypothetical protein
VATNYPEKEDQKTPKVTYGIPQSARNRALSESINREATNHGRNGKNNLQVNTLIPHHLALPWW